MTDIEVRVLDEDEWELYRNARLAALGDAPAAFVARLEDEASLNDDHWRERMKHATRIVAERGSEPVGPVCLGRHDGDPQCGEVFGLWTAPSVRGQHVARDLVTAARHQAADDDCRLLYFWVVSDNASAIGFAANVGFRPTSERRPVRVAASAAAKDADEVAMVWPLLAGPTRTPNPYRE
ncbi:MAG: GNAT family N-acetyltransferase [Nocardioides sp.]|nr:GNAT family N-acetyltransferase [Nocardioides sp.]